MAQEKYQGQVDWSAAKARSVTDADSLLPPADRNNYDPTAFANQPGAAARAAGYPRADGQPGRR